MMFKHRTSFLFWFLGGLALLIVSTGSLIAQEDTKKEAPPKTEEKKEEPTPWPPENTTKHEIKRKEGQKQGLILYTPESWKKGKPSNNLRLAEFALPAAQGEQEPVELTIFSFEGEGAGGGVRANVDRWIAQFKGNDTEKSILTGKGHQGLYVLVDLKGTYTPPPFQRDAKPIPDARMLAAIIGIRWEEKGADGKPEPKSAVYFLKVVGPEKTVSAHEKDFRLAFGAANRSNENPIPVKDEE